MRHFKTTMKLTILILSFIFLTNCNSTEQKELVEKSITTVIDTVEEIAAPIPQIKIDTTTLNGKREYILNWFETSEPRRYPDFDTLMDLTYDGHKDYVIGYYGSTGTGIKNRMQVFLYNKNIDNYILDSTLSDVANPTFYIGKRKITGFYIGGGGGGGHKLEWVKNKWVKTKTFTVDNDNGKGLWIIHYPLKHKTDTIHREFQMIPPDEILETDIKE